MDGLVAQLRDTQDSIQRIQHEAGPALIHANDLKKKMVENEAELKRIEVRRVLRVSFSSRSSSLIQSPTLSRVRLITGEDCSVGSGHRQVRKRRQAL